MVIAQSANDNMPMNVSDSSTATLNPERAPRIKAASRTSHVQSPYMSLTGRWVNKKLSAKLMTLEWRGVVWKFLCVQ